jgi:DNA adenine methylase
MGRYIEVFGGAGWVLLRKDKHASFEVYNDADGELVNLFRCVKFHPAELQRELEWCINSREVFNDYRAGIPGLTDIQRAARFFMLVKYSYGCDRTSYGCTSKPGMANAIADLDLIHQRLQRVVIEHKDFADIIRAYDRPDALFYCDPPYMGTEAYYDVRFTWSDHERLCERLRNIKGRFLLSYNECPAVRELYQGYTIEAVSRSHNLAMRYDAEGYAELLIRNF